MAAVGWAECGNYGRAGMYARRALNDSSGVDEGLKPILRMLAERIED
jgi:hypothetical protein